MMLLIAKDRDFERKNTSEILMMEKITTVMR